MKYRPLASTSLALSEIGFGVWSVSTGWWGKVAREDGIALMRRAFDLGITFFDTADAYGNGYGEEILADALGRQRSDLVIGTKFGYDLETGARTGHQERPQNWSPDFVRDACERSLRRLRTDVIDLYQLHNARLTAIQNDDLLDTLNALRKEGKIREYGLAVGPDIGWYEEGACALTERKMPCQIIYSILEQDPARDFIKMARKENIGLLTRVPHASGMLDGTYTKDTVVDQSPFEPGDHRSFRRMEWMRKSITKLRMIDFLFRGKEATVGQIALKFCLEPDIVASVLPTITSLEQLEEYASAPDAADLPADEIQRLAELYADNFGMGEKEPLRSSR